METIHGVLWFICTIFIWIQYHRFFTVYYFDLGAGLGKEILICTILGAFLAGIIIWSIPIAIIIFIIFLIIKKLKKDKTNK